MEAQTVDLPIIHFCKKLTEVPGYRSDLILYTPHIQLKSTSDPVHQVVKAAVAEHCGKGRPRPREVWIWGANVYVPKEGQDGQN